MPVKDLAIFRGLVLRNDNDRLTNTIEELQLADLPQGDVLISVAYSGVNYKDALAVTDSAPVVRRFPIVPGIDLSGIVEASSSAEFQLGDRVIATGWGLGELHWGGFAQKARLKSEWLLPLPDGLSLQQAMLIGTAGLTAMLSVMALEEHGLQPGQGEVVVTGATGGVGSFAIALLAKLGYRVIASTGRQATLSDYCSRLGASHVISRFAKSDRTLESERWAGAIDTVGGDTLAALLRQTNYGGSIAACGMAGGGTLPTSVYPFILRGVNLLGIDSVFCSITRRQQAWQRLAELLSSETLDLILARVIHLEDIVATCSQLLQGQTIGRVVLDLNLFTDR